MSRLWRGCVVLGLLAATRPAGAQWFDIADPLGDTVCGIINAADGVLLVFGEDGHLILIRSTDLSLSNTGLDEDLNVIIDGEQFGSVDYADDSLGRRRAFWITPIGSLYGLTPDGEPVATTTYPGDVEGFCDPCEFWDNTADCVDEPADDTDASSSSGGALINSLCGAGAGSGTAAAMVSMFCLAPLRPRRSP